MISDFDKENDEEIVLLSVDNRKSYYCQGLLHRQKDKPAYSENNAKYPGITIHSFYVRGKKHRVCGPAFEGGIWCLGNVKFFEVH